MRLRIYGTAQTQSKPHECDGIDDDNNFADYLYAQDKEVEESLISKVVSGYMRFKDVSGQLMTYTEYDLTEKLTDVELEALKGYTQGQWSDGIGEGFEQFPCGEDSGGGEIYISPWHIGQEVSHKYL